MKLRSVFTDLQFFGTMQTKKYNDIKTFLIHGRYPKEYSSNKSNFVATARKYKINKKGNLLRDGKLVVKNSSKQKIFDALHNHSGRTACWERIRAR